MKGINWYGWHNHSSGYGVVNLEYSTALERLTGKVSIGWERQEDILKENYDELTDEQKALINKPYKKERIGIIKTTPQMFFKNTSEFRIGYTMVENTQIGPDWVQHCNKMDAIFVPSEFLVEVFKSCGVTVPVISIKQGMDSRKFPYYEKPKTEKFVFGTIGYQDERKNWEDLVVAFCSEFNRNEPVELWIKNSNPYWGYKCFKDRRIKAMNRIYSFSEIQELYKMFDCFVFPSHAEGSGLPPREAMAIGLPVILTNWSGLTEISNPKISYPIDPIAIDFPDIRGPEQPGMMARINVKELMYQMRYVYEHPMEARKKGKEASKFVHENYSWDACAKDLYKKLEQF
jgi:glycosyltransferase involved in cell wall biosynthesis